MIFKQIDEIVTGRKTVTRRIVKPGEIECVIPLSGDRRFFKGDKMYVAYPAVEVREITRVEINGRLKWQVGDTYAVVPGRGKPGMWWQPETEEWAAPEVLDQPGAGIWYLPNSMSGVVVTNWRPLRIRITAIRQERLQDISEEDARAEGYIAGPTVIDNLVPNMATNWYARLWDSINGKGSWDKNPLCWVISFQVVKP